MPVQRNLVLPSVPLSVEACRLLLLDALTLVTTNSAQCTAEAHLLLENVTGLSQSAWLAYPETLIPLEALTQLNELLQKRLEERCPIQYILGEGHFYGLTFAVTPVTLIPRPETELLVEAAITEALRRLEASLGPLTMVDVGTGSGCIPIAIGQSLRSQLSNDDWKRVELLAIDYSPEALAVAQQNAATHAIPITFYHGSWLQPVLAEKIIVDMIVANPPYIPSSVCDTLEPEVIGHEPRLALDGGFDGLAPYRELLAQANDCLTPNGWVGLEFGEDQASVISVLANQLGFASIQIHRDFSGNERFFTAQKAG